MSKLSIDTHISRQFNAELEDVRQQVLAMGGLVEEQVAAAISALTGGNGRLAEEVVARDTEVNHMEVAIDETCSHILARRQPTASDLRLIVAIIKVITDLERIGDEAEKIARMALHLITQDRPANAYQEVAELGAIVRQMAHDALDTFARLDPTAAISVAETDERVDSKYEAIMRQSITFMMEDPRAIRRTLDVLWAVRALERIGDHSRNICEYVIYLVHGKDVRHTNLEDTARDVLKDSR
jgi:phosphate transport system protein